MIQLSPRGRAIYQLLTLTVLLTLVYALCLPLSASYALPDSPLAAVVAWQSVDALMRGAYWLALLTGMLTTGLLLHPARASGARSSLWTVWRVGMLLLAIALPLPALAMGETVAAARAFQLHVAGGLSALVMAYWLFGRISRVERDWAEASLRICALLLLLGGGIVAVGRLILPAPLSAAAAPLVLLCAVTVASHWYRALSHRHAVATLSPHWLALSTLLVVSGGIVGALSIQPGVQAAMRGTDLLAAQDWLARCLPLFALLALVNQTASELRGDNRRVTGYAPVWLLGFGAALASVCLAGRGLLQVYLDADAALLLPLTALWLLCLLAFAAGMLVYALGYAARLPKICVIDD